MSKKTTGSKVYRLKEGKGGESFMLKTGRKGDLTIYDETKKVRRAIRHCPNQESAFIDEQDDYALVKPILFINGYLTVGEQYPTTQNFLDLSPYNAANGGGLFEEVNDEKEAKEAIELDELIMDAKVAVRKVAKAKDGIHELRSVAAVLTGSVDDTMDMQTEELKYLIYSEIEDNINRFIDDSGNVTIFDDDNVKRKYIILRALKDGVIKKSTNGKSILWKKDNQIIATAPKSVNLIEYFADYLTTDDGILVLEEIIKRS